MLTQADLKRFRSLQEKKPRGMSKRFLVQGRKVVAELLGSRFRTEVVLATEEAAAFIKPLADKAKVRVEILPSHELDKIGTFEKGNELIGIAVEPENPSFRPPAEDELMLAFDGVRDPRNLGSVCLLYTSHGRER